MHFSLTALVLAGTAVNAFSDTTPFVLFSTAKLNIPSNAPWIQTEIQVISSAKEIVASCPTDRYLLVSVPNLHASDIRVNGKCAMPQLCDAVSSKTIASVFDVREVWGQVSSKRLEKMVTETCSAQGKQISVDLLELRHLPSQKETKARAEVLADNDDELGQLFETLSGDYTVLVFSDPNEFQVYEPEFVEPVHMDLKRDADPVYIGNRQASTNSSLPLFERYQFFTPGVFMTLVAVTILLMVLSAGLSALSSLQVSYGSFDKEMGPAAHRKQM